MADKSKRTPGALKPGPALLCKLGSIIVHFEEMNSKSGHAFDKIALVGLVSDPEIQTWLDDMRAIAMVPVKRKT